MFQKTQIRLTILELKRLEPLLLISNTESVYLWRYTAVQMEKYFKTFTGILLTKIYTRTFESDFNEKFFTSFNTRKLFKESAAS